jgi:hypothetical protein
MREEIKNIWIKALKSGEYKQTTENLKRGSNYCCLGVLCDIVKDEVNGEWDGDIFTQGPLSEHVSLMPPQEVYSFVGLNRNDASDLARKNDSGESFESIADWVRDNL